MPISLFFGEKLKNGESFGKFCLFWNLEKYSLEHCLKLLVHHLSDVYFDAVKSDVYSDVYIYLGRLAGEGSRVTHHLKPLKLNVYLHLQVSPRLRCSRLHLSLCLSVCLFVCLVTLADHIFVFNLADMETNANANVSIWEGLKRVLVA